MLKERSEFLQRRLFVIDILLIVTGWIAAYYTRFELLTPPQWLPLTQYLTFLPWVVLVWAIVLRLSGLYQPDEIRRLPRVVYSVGRAVFFSMAAVVASLFFYRAFSFSRLHMILFGIYTSMLMVGVRIGLLYLQHQAQRGTASPTNVLIVGANRLGRQLEETLEAYPWMDFNVLGFVDAEKEGSEILGTPDMIDTVVEDLSANDSAPDHVYITLPLRHGDLIEHVINTLSKELAHVYLVPQVHQFDIVNSRITEIDGLPVIHLYDEPPPQIKYVAKRIFDIIFSILTLLVTLPLMAVIALMIKLTSSGPVFYRQKRMGLNGHTFSMLKFRTMPVGSEEETGPIWSTEDDDRATSFGAFLRQTSLDELPQFINVVKGDMSVVGPRPERPVFIEEFRKHVPRYMLRHKMKAGITGWAQVNGWRGDTSIEKRIEYDLYYIRNWSLSLDMKIILLTLWRGMFRTSAS